MRPAPPTAGTCAELRPVSAARGGDGGGDGGGLWFPSAPAEPEQRGPSPPPPLPAETGHNSVHLCPPQHLTPVPGPPQYPLPAPPPSLETPHEGSANPAPSPTRPLPLLTHPSLEAYFEFSLCPFLTFFFFFFFGCPPQGKPLGTGAAIGAGLPLCWVRAAADKPRPLSPVPEDVPRTPEDVPCTPGVSPCTPRAAQAPAAGPRARRAHDIPAVPLLCSR